MIIEKNKWYIFENMHPNENEKVLIFRIKKEKFTVATLKYREENEDNEIEARWDWITENNLCYDVNPLDRWMKFEPLLLMFDFTKIK